MDTTKLRELAGAATPGPWTLTWGSRMTYRIRQFVGGRPDGTKLAVTRNRNDAAYIAAASPDVVLALLDVAEAARLVIENGPADREGAYFNSLVNALEGVAR